MKRILTVVLWSSLWVTPVWAVDAVPSDPVLDTAIEAVVEEAKQARKEQIAERERQVSTRESRLLVMRTELEKLISKNQDLRKELIERESRINQANTEKVKKLIKVYEAMAPEEAAPILDAMEQTIVLSVFSGMKGKAAAGIMELMPKDKAARLGEELARPN